MSSRPRPSRATWNRLMEVCTTVGPSEPGPKSAERTERAAAARMAGGRAPDLGVRALGPAGGAPDSPHSSRAGTPKTSPALRSGFRLRKMGF